ncbi:MAG: glycosyltransferase family 4 protein [Chloroflexota bacterium]|nr:glycosyltransferase family 4 protein [Chloroflexota bacterium]
MAQRPRLRLALVAPLVSPIAPPFLGGAQVLLHDLALGLAQRGHSVTMFAARGSHFKNGSNVTIREVEVGSTALKQAAFHLRDEDGAESADATFFHEAELFLEIFLEINRSNHYDLAHAHAFDWPVYAYAPLTKVPTLHTVHLPAVDRQINNILGTTYRKTGISNCVTVSKTCAATYQDFFAFDRVIYNGVELATIPFGSEAEDFLLYVGRIAPEKGPDLAIDIATRTGRRLVMVGGIYDANFFEEQILPRLAANRKVEYLGRLERAQIAHLMSHASCLLFPSRWEEPFGLVLIEAMAAGTPVVAFERGAAPELIIQGKTGLLVAPDNVEQAVAAVEKSGQLDRRECRRHVETHFSLAKMLDEYEDYYYSKL